MKNTFFSSLFKQNKAIKKEESKVFETLRSLQYNTNLTLFFDIEVFHHKQSYKIPLIIYDKYRGLYLFEIKDWSYEDLKNATITKAKQQKSAQNTLAYDNMNSFIKRKFNEIIHTDGVEIFNYLLLTNLTSHEYKALDDSLKTVLVQEKILFANETKNEITDKLQLPPERPHSLGSDNLILGTLLTQYSILDKQNQIYLLNPQQQAFIDAKLTGITYLNGEPKSGKSSLLLLKAIYELLKNPQQKIVILKPTNLAKEILHKQFLEIVEHAIIELDLLSIQIMTSHEFFHTPQHKNLILLCDDTDLLDDITKTTLLQKYKQTKKVFVNAVNGTADYQLKQHYQNEHKNIVFYQTQPYAKALNILPNLLKKSPADDIIIVSDKETAQKLYEDLELFVKEKVFLIDSTQKLANQNLNGIKIADFKDLNQLNCEHILILHNTQVSSPQLTFAINLANSSAHVLFKTESPQIQEMKEKYESS